MTNSTSSSSAPAPPASRRRAGSPPAASRCLVLEARERPGGRAWTSAARQRRARRSRLRMAAFGREQPVRRHRRGAGARCRPLAAALGPRRRADRAGSRRMGRLLRGAWARFRERVDNRPPDAPDVACDTLLDPRDPFNPLIDAVSTYYSGAELAKVSAADLAAYDDFRRQLARARGLWRGGRRPRRGPAGALRLPGPRHRPQRRAARRRDGDRARSAPAPSSSRCRPTCWRRRRICSALPCRRRPRPRQTCRSASPTSSTWSCSSRRTSRRDSRAFGDMGRRATGAYHFRPLGRPIDRGLFRRRARRGAGARAATAAACDFAAANSSACSAPNFARRDPAAALLRLAHRPIRARRLFLRASAAGRQPRRAGRAGRGPPVFRRRSLLDAEPLDRARRL